MSLEQAMPKRLAWALLVLILAGGLFLRAWGAGHGLPKRIVHCDTGHQIAMMTVFLQGRLAHQNVKGTVLTGYAQPHIYLGAAFYAGWRLLQGWWGPAPPPIEPGLDRQSLPGLAGAVVLARLINACASAAVPLLLFLIARRLWGTQAGLLAAALGALDTVGIMQAHFAMPEHLQVAAMALCLYLALAHWQSGGRARLWGAFFAAGLAGASKYYGGLIIVAPLLAWWFADQRRVASLFPGFLAALAGFAAFTPWIWVDPLAWLTAPWGLRFLWEQGATGAGGLAHTLATFPQRWAFLFSRYAPPVVIAWALAFFWLAARRRKEELPLLAVFLLGWLLIVFARANYFRERDVVFLVPFMNLAAAGLLAASLDSLGRLAGGRCLRLAGAAGLAAIVWWQFGPAFDAGYAFHLPDTREQAEDWLLAREKDQNLIPRHPRSSNTLATRLSGPSTAPGKIPSGFGWRAGDLLRDHPGALYLAADRWDPLGKGQPLQVSGVAPLRLFSTVRASWANPVYYLFRLDGLDAAPRLFLPRIKLNRPTGPLGLYTAYEHLSPIDLVLSPGGKARASLFPAQPPGPMLAVAFGNGRLDLFSRAGRHKLEPRPGKPALALFTPAKAALPVTARRYPLQAESNGRPGLVRVFPWPQGAAPLLWDLKLYREIAALPPSANPALPAEFGLIRAAALERLGQKEAAARERAALEKSHPGLAARYGQVSQVEAGPARAVVWRELARASSQEMEARAYGLAPAKAELLLCAGAGEKPLKALTLSARGKWQVWSPPLFGPGRFKVELRVLRRAGPAGGKAVFSVFKHHDNRLAGLAGRLEVAAGDLPQGRPVDLVLFFDNLLAPLGLEFKLENAGLSLAVAGVKVSPQARPVLAGPPPNPRPGVCRPCLRRLGGKG